MSILRGFTELFKTRPAEVYQSIFDISHTVSPQLIYRLSHIDGLDLLVNFFPDRILLTNFHQLKMPPKEVARSIHKIIAVLHLAAGRKSSPKAIEYTAPDERTGYIDDTPDSYINDSSEKARSMILWRIVGHRCAIKGCSSGRQNLRRSEERGIEATNERYGQFLNTQTLTFHLLLMLPTAVIGSYV
jgi:hypothetical protein